MSYPLCQKKIGFIPVYYSGLYIYIKYLVGCGNLLAVHSECHETGGQVYQTANLKVHVAAAWGVSSIGHIATPYHVAVTPLHAIKHAKICHSVCPLLHIGQITLTPTV